MKISTLLDHIESGHMALPEFQRGYVWNRDQVRSLFNSLYHKHPVGGLLVWATESITAHYRGDTPPVPGIVKLLLDGQQRLTSLYGVARGKPPKFFDGNAEAFTGLQFHLEKEEFAFYQPLKMRDDPLWVDVTTLMKRSHAGVGELMQNPKVVPHFEKLSRLLSITDIDLFVDEITGRDKTIGVVVDIFNRVNSGGTKLSKGDLALAKICAEWPEARDEMKLELKNWAKADYHFDLDWLLRSVNTVLTGEAKFSFLHDKGADDIKSALKKATKHINACLNLISGRLGLDHDRVLFGRFAVPVMVRYLDIRNTPLSEKERDKMLFWYLQAGMWGRFSGSTESFIDQDLALLEGETGGLDNLLKQLRLWHGPLRVETGHFSSMGMGSRFYPILYLLTRMGSARDWGTGIPLKANLLGKMSRLEVHHIFPKSQLYKRNFSRAEVNALANFCFLTKETNLVFISDRLPEEYFPMIEEKHPGALASQWIPSDPILWKAENYLDFLEARKTLLAEEANKCFKELLHDETHWLEGKPVTVLPEKVEGGIASQEEEEDLIELNNWVETKGLTCGTLAYELSDPVSGMQKAVFDLAWPNGIQVGLSQPVAVLFNESPNFISLASREGFRCFTKAEDFKVYVQKEILNELVI